MSISSRINTIEEHIGDIYDTLELGGFDTIVVPDEYKQLEYIESSGTQYIDTGFIPNSNTKYEVKAINNTIGYLIGAATNTLRNNIYFNINNKFSAGYGTQYYNSPNSPASNVINSLVLDKNKFYVNNVLQNTFTEETFENEVKALIFARNYGGADGFINAKLYTCKIYDNDTLVRDFIPCYRISDSVIGLYDTVNNVFYTNAGTGTFTAGPVVFNKNIVNIPTVIKDRYKDYLANGTDTLWNNWEKVTGSGTNVTLSNTLKGKMDVGVSGNTKQQSYTGKNLVDISQANDSKVYGTGSTISFTENGFTVTTSSSDFRGDYFSFPVVSGKTYTVFFKATGFTNYRIYADNTGTTEIARNLASETKYTFTASATQLLYLRFWTNANLTATLDYAQIEEGSNNTAYEPYVGRIASPNPSYPQEIYNISGEVEVKVENKNIYNSSLAVNNMYQNYNNPYWSMSPNNSYWCTGLQKIKPNTNYTISTTPTITVCYDKDRNPIPQGLRGATITTQATAYYMNCCYVKNSFPFGSDLQIEEGSTATSYEPHEEQTATLHLPEGMEMCKSAYGEYTDDFIKQGDKWYKYKQNMKRRLLASNIQSIGGLDSTKGYIQLIGITDKLNGTSVWCNYLTNVALQGAEDNSNKIGIANINTDGAFRIRYKTGELTLAGANEFLTNNEVIIQYRLKTPVLEEITDPTLISDLESLKNLYSYKGTTYISSSNEPSPVFEVVALKDM